VPFGESVAGREVDFEFEVVVVFDPFASSFVMD